MDLKNYRQEQNNAFYKVKHMIKALANGEDVTFIFEHTTHTNTINEFVSEGIEWMQSL
jgi:hypothetical protein